MCLWVRVVDGKSIWYNDSLISEIGFCQMLFQHRMRWSYGFFLSVYLYDGLQPMNTWFSTRGLKVCNGRRKASLTNGAGITECQPVEEWK